MNVTMKSRAVNFAYQAAPSVNYWEKTGYARVQAGTGTTAYTYIWFSMPFPRGVKVRSAKLRIRVRAAAAAASRSLTARTITSRGLNYSKLTWNTRPTETFYGPASVVAVAGALTNNTLVEFDMTRNMQMVADGQGWYGFRIETNNAAGLLIQNHRMGASYTPELLVEWSDAPLAPDRLSPSSDHVVADPRPVLRFDFEDYGGDRDMAAYRVQIQTDLTKPVFTPQIDTGEVLSTIPQCDLSTIAAFAPMAAGASAYWRVLVKDGAGIWSPTSSAVKWTYQPLPTVTINSPGAAGTVTDPTPVIDWSVTGGTQAKWRVNIYLWTNGKWVLNSSSGMVAGTATTWTPPRAIGPNGRYRVVVDVFDNRADREAVPGYPVYASASREFTYKFSNTVPSPTAGVATPSSRRPSITLTWTAANAPDRWVILRDGEPFAVYPGPTLFKSGTQYQITDQYPAPRVNHTWSVVAVQNGVSSEPLLITGKTNPVGTWIGSVDGKNQLCIVNDKDREVVFYETTEAFHVPGALGAVVVTSGMGGYEGTLKGQLRQIPQIPGVTAHNWKDIALLIKEDILGSHFVVWGDEAFRAVLTDVQVARSTRLPDTYEFSCKFYQQTDFNYEADF